MTNKDFVDQIKSEQNMRGNTVVNDLRQVLKEIGVNTSAYKARIDPHSAAWVLYATLIAPSTRKTAIDWIKDTAKLFEEKKERGEFTPIDFLRDQFENPKSAEALERVVIDQVTGDLYAFAIEHPGQPVDVLRYDFKENAEKRPGTMIQYLIQVTGDYFRAYHQWNVKQN